MRIHKLSTVDAFIAFDLDGAPSSVGTVRLAPKILQGGAKDLARSITYMFASFEMQRSGASAGINVAADDRDSAVATFVEEITPLVREGTFLPDAGLRMTDDDLASLHEHDPRNPIRLTVGDHVRGVGAAAAAGEALGGLEGRTIAIEGFDAAGPALAAEAVRRGASIVAIGTTKGSALRPEGFDPAALADAWTAHGIALVDHLGDASAEAWKVLATPVDVLFAGSKAGCISHTNAAKLEVGALVPHGPLPFTARALAILRRAGTTVVPDFISTAGPLFANWADPGSTAADVEAQATSAITAAMREVGGHEDGHTLAACYRAEAFLSTWQDALPFGRPMAS